MIKWLQKPNMNDCLNTLSWQFVTLLVKKTSNWEYLRRKKLFRWFFFIHSFVHPASRLWCRGEVIEIFLNCFCFVCQMCNWNCASSIVLICTHEFTCKRLRLTTENVLWTNSATFQEFKFGLRCHNIRVCSKSVNLENTGGKTCLE